jgi:ABC-type transporter Mla MlaB component
MLRITAEQHGATWVLKLEGNLQGEWLGELRRCWRQLRDATPPVEIAVELADIQFIDAAGKALLTEMYRDGVELIARGFLASALREELIARSTESGNTA